MMIRHVIATYKTKYKQHHCSEEREHMVGVDVRDRHCTHHINTISHHILLDFFSNNGILNIKMFLFLFESFERLGDDVNVHIQLILYPIGCNN